MMEQSLAELRTTVDDLEKRMEGLDEESMLSFIKTNQIQEKKIQKIA